MRVLLVSDSFFPQISGIAMHVHSLARFLVSQGHYVHVITSNTDINKNVNFDGFTVSYLIKIKKNSEMIFDVLDYVNSSLSVAKIIDKYSHSYDIVHYHGTRLLFLNQIRAKTPLIITLHDVAPSCVFYASTPHPCGFPSAAKCASCRIIGKPSQQLLQSLPVFAFSCFYYKAMKMSLKKANRVICVSNSVKQKISNSLELENLKTLHNFIDVANDITPVSAFLKEFNVREYLKIPSNASIITFFGRLSAEKGIYVLLQAFENLCRTFDSEVYLVIGGAGSERQNIERVATSNPNVIFVGSKLSRLMLLSIMACSDLSVVPSVCFEACPTAILEAMALGVPIVATSNGGSAELVVDNETGYLVKPNDPNELAEKMLKILNKGKLKFRTQTLANAAQYDIKYIGKMIEQLYFEQVLCATVNVPFAGDTCKNTRS